MRVKPVMLTPSLLSTNEENEKNENALERKIVFWGEEAYKLPTKTSQSIPKT